MNYIKRTIILLILFVVVSPINSPKQLQIISIQKFKMTNSNYNLVILLLQKALSCGDFGHCSIAIDDKTILQIEGPGDKPTTQSFESFKYNYASGKNDWMKVYRCSYPGAGKKAAEWVKKNYENTNHRYLVTLNLNSKNLHIVLKLSIKLINWCK